MKKILEELWYGNICPDSKYNLINKEAKDLIKHIATNHDNLNASLTDDQKLLLEKYDECYAELNDINEREVFIYAFRLGARIAFEIMDLDIE